MIIYTIELIHIESRLKMKKILLTGLGPISNKIHSHKAAQAIIYADQLKQAGMDVTINLVSNKIID